MINKLTNSSVTFLILRLTTCEEIKSAVIAKFGCDSVL